MVVISKGWLPAGAAHLGEAQWGHVAAPHLPALCFKPAAGLGCGEVRLIHLPPLGSHNYMCGQGAGGGTEHAEHPRTSPLSARVTAVHQLACCSQGTCH